LRAFLCFTHLLHFCYEPTYHDLEILLSLATADPALIMAASSAGPPRLEKPITIMSLFGLREFNRHLRLSSCCAVVHPRIEFVGISQRCCPLRNVGSKMTHFGCSRSVQGSGLRCLTLITVQNSTNLNVLPLQIEATSTPTSEGVYYYDDAQ
jgi:hypothetical protein